MAFSPPTLASETIAHIGSFPIRNSMVMGWIAMAVLIIGAIIFKRRSGRLVPKGFQNFVEVLIEGLFNFFNSITQDRAQTKKFFPIVATIFIFVIISNWMGIFPGVGPIGFYEEHEGLEIFIPYLRSGYADVNMTLALAIISVVATQIYGMVSLGFFHYAGKFFVNPLKDFIGSFVGLLELISEFAKMISFSFRLFGNIFAGEVLLVVIGFLAPFIAPLPFYGLEIFVGFVQALVFSLLTLVFMKMAVTSHHEHAH
ncbi:F0F1 ATP synthase subunit A [Candidatus Peregrinibacteria bacterium]|nr:F0F1 ATP synthase subunit A [Candidatus Peregrinibacteria bacterium]